MKFDIFVIPFISGLAYIFIYIFLQYRRWIMKLSKRERTLLRKHVFSRYALGSIKEIFRESLFHIKVFKTNPLLGYMHMSLAFGWFLLIVFGNIEIKFYSQYSINPPYVPIFLRFFEPTPAPHFFGRGSNFFMDFLLLWILTGVGLALIKRVKSKAFGMKNITLHNRFDKLALYVLWFIFPLRFFAESFTSGIYHNGSFLTGTAGTFFASFLPVELLAYPTWWLYSIALGLFFVFLPFSRYTHIPSEPLLILMRNAGIKPCLERSAYSLVELHSCSHCGICINTCQLSDVLGINTIQPTYFIRNVRYNKPDVIVLDNCLLCGRCNTSCPVGINSTQIRQGSRILEYNHLQSNFSYLPSKRTHQTDVIYFAGCMTHLTPTISKSMTSIFNKSGVQWQFLDIDGSICCGRPLMVNGQMQAASQLISKNKQQIQSVHAKTLVTSCPICYKAFKEHYNLDIEVLHHSQYILRLIEEEKIYVKKTDKLVMYHDPCELGRNSMVYIEPRIVINHVAELIEPNNFTKEKALCCGGSLGNTKLSLFQRKGITANALKKMDITKAHALITSCPLCKKTFESVTENEIIDISQLVNSHTITKDKKYIISARKPIESSIIIENKY